MSPAVTIPECTRRGDMLGVAFDPERIPEEIRSDRGWVLGGNYCRVAQSIHVEEAIDRYGGPVLIVHGAEDETIPVRCAAEAAKRYRSAQLAIIPGDTHCYDYHLEEAVEAVRVWISALAESKDQQED
jgi:hypothetical protein